MALAHLSPLPVVRLPLKPACVPAQPHCVFCPYLLRLRVQEAPAWRHKAERVVMRILHRTEEQGECGWHFGIRRRGIGALLHQHSPHETVGVGTPTSLRPVQRKRWPPASPRPLPAARHPGTEENRRLDTKNAAAASPQPTSARTDLTITARRFSVLQGRRGRGRPGILPPPVRYLCT